MHSRRFLEEEIQRATGEWEDRSSDEWGRLVGRTLTTDGPFAVDPCAEIGGKKGIRRGL